MDIANQNREDMKLSSPRVASDSQGPSGYSMPIKNGIKRSFDVAFLMLPDEKLKNRRTEKMPCLSTNAVVTYPAQISVRSDESLKELVSNHRPIAPNYDHPQRFINRSPQFERSNNNNESAKSMKFNMQSRSLRIYDDPTIIPSVSANRDPEAPRSAFTKVPHNRQESPIPPPLSPDQMSCPSASPPVSISPPRSTGYPSFRAADYQFMNGTPFHTITQIQQAAQTQKFKQQLMYHHRPMQSQSNNDAMPTGYLQSSGGFPFGVGNHPFAPQQELHGIVRNPAAAALLTTLIPPTIATSFSLTAQNVCAKCNISFRMTSDLVYHMRSHHKSEYTIDNNQRRKREEKLKCPVCNESFRERHHLTRHMTAHQDKESDEAATIEINRRQNKWCKMNFGYKPNFDMI